MSSERIFDYLDGRLPDAERAAFERELAADSDLQRDLEAARAIERGFDSLQAYLSKMSKGSLTRFHRLASLQWPLSLR